MALGATIYKIQLHVADTDRHHYETHVLTVARHPSETEQRLMVRLLAFALHAQERLAFTKGIADSDEPDLWLKDLSGSIELWIEIGQPSDTRLSKACGRAAEVVVYCFGGHASKVWWDGLSPKTKHAGNLRVVSLPQEVTSQLANHTERNMSLHVNISDAEISIPIGQELIVVSPDVWKQLG